jgi:transposase InsO family protein
VLQEYLQHYNTHRPHRSLRQHPPAGRVTPRSGATVRSLRRDRLGGLIHEYVQVTCPDRVLGTHTVAVPWRPPDHRAAQVGASPQIRTACRAQICAKVAP